LERLCQHLEDQFVLLKRTLMLGCYILCSESLVEVDRLVVKVEGRSVQLGKFEVEVIDNKLKRSIDKRS
jgi:hypothetical protein